MLRPLVLLAPLFAQVEANGFFTLLVAAFQ